MSGCLGDPTWRDKYILKGQYTLQELEEMLRAGDFEFFFNGLSTPVRVELLDQMLRLENDKSADDEKYIETMAEAARPLMREFIKNHSQGIQVVIPCADGSREMLTQPAIRVAHKEGTKSKHKNDVVGSKARSHAKVIAQRLLTIKKVNDKLRRMQNRIDEAVNRANQEADRASKLEDRISELEDRLHTVEQENDVWKQRARKQTSPEKIEALLCFYKMRTETRSAFLAEESRLLNDLNVEAGQQNAVIQQQAIQEVSNVVDKIHASNLDRVTKIRQRIKQSAALAEEGDRTTHLLSLLLLAETSPEKIEALLCFYKMRTETRSAFLAEESRLLNDLNVEAGRQNAVIQQQAIQEVSNVVDKILASNLDRVTKIRQRIKQSAALAEEGDRNDANVVATALFSGVNLFGAVSTNDGAPALGGVRPDPTAAQDYTNISNVAAPAGGMQTAQSSHFPPSSLHAVHGSPPNNDGGALPGGASPGGPYPTEPNPYNVQVTAVPPNCGPTPTSAYNLGAFPTPMVIYTTKASASHVASMASPPTTSTAPTTACATATSASSFAPSGATQTGPFALTMAAMQAQVPPSTSSGQPSGPHLFNPAGGQLNNTFLAGGQPNNTTGIWQTPTNAQSWTGASALMSAGTATHDN